MKTKVILIAVCVCSIALLVSSLSWSDSGQAVNTAASKYLPALIAGPIEDYFAYEKSFQEGISAEKKKFPSSMWAQVETSMRDVAIAKMNQAANGNSYGRGNYACYLIFHRGATARVKEVRSLSASQWQVFYEVSYAESYNSPKIILQNGKLRLFRSGMFSVDFEKSANKNPVAQSDCSAVPGSVTTWTVPTLTADIAVLLANKSNVLPKHVAIEIGRTAGVSSGQNWESWKQFVEAGQLLKSTLERHGWSVSGFTTPSVGYYNISGQIEPPDSSRKWIISNIRGTAGYNVVFLENPESTLLDFSSQEDTATAHFITKFSGCTDFCELWKDVRQMPFYIGSAIFYGSSGNYNPSFDFNGSSKTTVNYAWSPDDIWYVQQ